MNHTRSDPQDARSASENAISTTLEIQRERGIVYLYGRDGSPLLKITGLPTPIPTPSVGTLLTISITEQRVEYALEVEPIVSCQHWPGDSFEFSRREVAADPRAILAQAGATIIPHKR